MLLSASTSFPHLKISSHRKYQNILPSSSNFPPSFVSVSPSSCVSVPAAGSLCSSSPLLLFSLLCLLLWTHPTHLLGSFKRTSQAFGFFRLSHSTKQTLSFCHPRIHTLHSLCPKPNVWCSILPVLISDSWCFPPQSLSHPSSDTMFLTNTQTISLHLPVMSPDIHTGTCVCPPNTPLQTSLPPASYALISRQDIAALCLCFSSPLASCLSPWLAINVNTTTILVLKTHILSAAVFSLSSSKFLRNISKNPCREPLSA